MINENVIKKIFLIFNGLFIFTGLLFIAIGFGVRNEFNKYVPFIEDRYYALTILFIVCGSLTFMTALLGHFGTVKRHPCAMFTFCGVSILLFILALTAGILGLIMQSQAWPSIDKELRGTMDDYLNGDRETQKAWDQLQEKLYCCGSNGFENWADLIEKKFNKTELPLSCCNKIQKIKYTNCTYEYDSSWRRRVYDYQKVRDYGCYDILSPYISGMAYALSIIAFTFSAIHLFGILLSLLVAYKVKTPYQVKNN